MKLEEGGEVDPPLLYPKKGGRGEWILVIPDFADPKIILGVQPQNILTAKLYQK